MVQSVTISGSHYESVVLDFGATSNFLLAQQLSSFLNTQIADQKVVTEFDQGGTIPTLPPGTTGAYVQTTTQTVVLPTGYTTDLVTKPGDAVVFGSGAPDQAILSDASTNLTFSAASGSGTVIAGGGNSRILLSAEAPPSTTQGASASGSSWLVYTGSGNDYI